MRLLPLSNNVIVRRDEPPEKTDDGIFLPASAQEASQTGIVVAVGPGALVDGERVPISVKEGDKVLLARYGGIAVKSDGENFLVLNEGEILAIVADG